MVVMILSQFSLAGNAFVWGMGVPPPLQFYWCYMIYYQTKVTKLLHLLPESQYLIEGAYVKGKCCQYSNQRSIFFLLLLVCPKPMNSLLHSSQNIAVAFSIFRASCWCLGNCSPLYPMPVLQSSRPSIPLSLFCNGRFLFVLLVCIQCCRSYSS